mmetsp:Transcript_4286/g.8841  ORF Transcript_4286/g.8841 Transcript_4286/m.8841 type:complete len:321 (+) Transcript_4286:148-1110(+)
MHPVGKGGLRRCLTRSTPAPQGPPARTDTRTRRLYAAHGCLGGGGRLLGPLGELGAGGEHPLLDDLVHDVVPRGQANHVFLASHDTNVLILGNAIQHIQSLHVGLMLTAGGEGLGCQPFGLGQGLSSLGFAHCALVAGLRLLLLDKRSKLGSDVTNLSHRLGLNFASHFVSLSVELGHLERRVGNNLLSRRPRLRLHLCHFSVGLCLHLADLFLHGCLHDHRLLLGSLSHIFTLLLESLNALLVVKHQHGVLLLHPLLDLLGSKNSLLLHGIKQIPRQPHILHSEMEHTDPVWPLKLLVHVLDNILASTTLQLKNLVVVH